ncbi:hypothetical protein GJR95_04025 [Spirosoma endbachense]|uniref:Uncharacterized protein n=1 Tax=Spirosoma endbachense TaxID=2666025 RepID=A0A6P1VMF2_9BACT|nr:hypothetical protein [Spirosoma endbachense]QHV94243.1 hypothetical protein GJR95_04025 [Spirosoma endbachense]
MLRSDCAFVAIWAESTVFASMKGLTLEQDLYSDYLLVNQQQATATRLGALLEQQLSHDRLTRSLSRPTMARLNAGKLSSFCVTDS